MNESFLEDKAGAGALPVPHRDSIDMNSADFFERARERLSFDVPPALSDPSIVPKTGDRGTDWMLEIVAREKPIRQAAVLIGIVERDKPSVLLTTRSPSLNEHPGQISFPGGKIDPQDNSPLETALREANEEIGLTADFIEPVGYLDVYSTSFGFRILPTLARVRPGFDLHLNRGEVDDAFEVPLAFLMDPANHKQGTKEYRGRLRYFYEMPYEQRYIWGATAGMLRVLYERIYKP